MTGHQPGRPRRIAQPPLIGIGVLASLVVGAWGSFFTEKALYPSYVEAFYAPAQTTSVTLPELPAPAAQPDAVVTKTAMAPQMPAAPQKPEADLAALSDGLSSGDKAAITDAPADAPEEFARLSDQDADLRSGASLFSGVVAPTEDELARPMTLADDAPAVASEPEGEPAGIVMLSSLRPAPRPAPLDAATGTDPEAEIILASMTSSPLAVASSLRPQAVPANLRSLAVARTTDIPEPTQVVARVEPQEDARVSREPLIAGNTCGRNHARNMPNRRAGATGGNAFISSLGNGSGSTRDNAIINELARGNMPGFLHDLQPVVLRGRDARGSATEIVICVTPDYLALGSDRDFVRVPLGLPAASSIAGQFNMMLPTSRMVDAIYSQASIKVSPKPMQAGPQMSSTDYFLRHNATIEAQRQGRSGLIAGHKKDVVVANRMASNPGRVAIYGWHQSNGAPIQPVSTVHGASYADYSHGIRLVSRTAYVNGKPVDLGELLSSSRYAYLLNSDGPMPGTVIRVASR